MLARFEQTRDKMKDLNNKLDEQVSHLKADEDRCESTSQRGCELGDSEPVEVQAPPPEGDRPGSSYKVGRKGPLHFRRHYPSRAEAVKSNSGGYAH